MYYLKKFLKALASMFSISIIAFSIVSLISDRAELTVLGVDASIEKQELFRKIYGLDKPLIKRYTDWLYNISKGDFGISFRYNIEVRDIVLSSLKLTMLIALISLLITIIVSVILAFYLNKIKNRYVEKIIDSVLAISISIPSFCLALFFILIFSVYLKLFRLSYDGSIYSLLLACVIVAIPRIAHLSYNLKKNIYVESRQEYVKYLYSNGMSMFYLNIYVLKNAIITSLSLIGLIVIDLITGTVIVEQVFSIPGIGRLIVSSVASRDIPLIQALIIYTSLCVIVINLIIDLLYPILDKRVSIEGVKQ